MSNAEEGADAAAGKTERPVQLGWGHINLNVRNLDRSVAFYELLGFEIFFPAIPYLGLSSKPGTNPLPEAAEQALGLPKGTRGRACIMKLGAGFPMLDLTEFEAPPQSAPPLENRDRGFVRICLASQNLAQDHARLQAQGVEFLSAPTTAHDGLAEIAICSDPDGALIELIQIHLDRWPRPSPPG